MKTKFIKIENVKVPDGKFSIYDLRIFGSRKGTVPSTVDDFTVIREDTDTRRALLEWPVDDNAIGFIINYGIDENKLYSSVMVYDTSSLMLTGLNKDVAYYFSIDAFNESGIATGKKVIMSKN